MRKRVVSGLVGATVAVGVAMPAPGMAVSKRVLRTLHAHACGKKHKHKGCHFRTKGGSTSGKVTG